MSSESERPPVKRSPKQVAQLLKNKPLLKPLEHEVLQQRLTLSAVRRVLPTDLAAHCLAARADGQRLVLHTDSPVWASRLRFFSNQLASLLQNDLPSLREIKVKLLVSREPRSATRSRPRYSPYAADVVLSTAEQTASHDLRVALERLGRRLRGEQPS
jgi:hypothetical protein